MITEIGSGALQIRLLGVFEADMSRSYLVVVGFFSTTSRVSLQTPEHSVLGILVWNASAGFKTETIFTRAMKDSRLHRLACWT